MKMKTRAEFIELIKERAQKAWELMAPCRLCPRSCKVNRREKEMGFCSTGKYARVSSAFPHHGEEDCLRGYRGSGTIFFSGCNLGCCFCQNYPLSQGDEGTEESAQSLAEQILRLQAAGCHNLNLVTPTHVVAQILDALAIAVENGFHLPIVYNSGGYDSLETLRLLDGIIDIYMPDFKYWDADVAKQLSDARDYPETAARAITEMHRQVGDLVMDDRGIAERGLLVRHLVLPNRLAGTQEVMSFLSSEISTDTFVNVMGQYRPCWKASTVAEIDRPVSLAEVIEAKQMALEAGLTRLDR